MGMTIVLMEMSFVGGDNVQITIYSAHKVAVKSLCRDRHIVAGDSHVRRRTQYYTANDLQRRYGKTLKRHAERVGNERANVTSSRITNGSRLDNGHNITSTTNT